MRVADAVGADPGPSFLLLTPRQWRATAAIAAVISAVAGTVSWSISPWISATCGIAALIACHLMFSCRFIVALPHLAVLLAALQYVLAAWANVYWPPADPTYDIGEQLPTYLTYAGPLVVAVAVGWMLPLIGLPRIHIRDAPPNAALMLELDILLGLSILAAVIGGLVSVPGFGFVFLLLRSLRYVSVFARMLLGGTGWGWRLALVLGAEVILSAGAAMFHDLLLWSLWTILFWAFRSNARPLAILGVLAAGAIALPALHETKWQLRDDLRIGDPLAVDVSANVADTTLEQTGAFLRYFSGSFRRAITFQFEEQFVGDIAMRFNQGWIVNRVMMLVPDTEPYARGSTIASAIAAALLPRMIATEKTTAGGRESMARFANIDLGGETAMDLGYGGELYANFGTAGGAIGGGLYALFFGFIFRFICRRAYSSPIWWSLMPFILYAAAKAEVDVSYVLNWTVKACVLLAAVLIFLPNFRRALFARPTEPPRAAAGAHAAPGTPLASR